MTLIKQKPYISKTETNELVLHSATGKIHYLNIPETFLYNLGILTAATLDVIVCEKSLHEDSLVV